MDDGIYDLSGLCDDVLLIVVSRLKKKTQPDTSSEHKQEFVIRELF